MIIDFDLSTMLVCALIWLILFLFLLFVRKKKKMYLFIFSCFFVYMCLLVSKTQFPIYNLPGMKQTVFQDMQLIPFVTLTRDDVKTVVLNIIMTIPFGFLVQLLKENSWKIMLLESVGLGVGIELCQLIIALIIGSTTRIVDVNDVIFNAIGGIIGYLIFLLFKKMTLRFLKQDDILYQYLLNNKTLPRDTKKHM